MKTRNFQLDSNQHVEDLRDRLFEDGYNRVEILKVFTGALVTVVTVAFGY